MTGAEAFGFAGPEREAAADGRTTAREPGLVRLGSDEQRSASREESPPSARPSRACRRRLSDAEAERRKEEKGTDEFLMVAASKGDKAAYVVLYLRYHQRIVKFCRRLLGNDAEGEEAAQDVFVKLYATRDRYEPKSRFAVFIYRIALNHCLNIRAGKGRKITSSGHDMEREAASSGHSPRAQAERGRLREALRTAVQTLPARQAAALTLCHVHGFSSEEAGALLESSGRAIKALVHRARRKLSATQRDALIGVKGWAVTDDG